MLVNLIIGIISSLIASVIVIWYLNRKNKNEIKMKYSGPVGHYYGHPHKENSDDTINMNDIISEVEISYISENKLKLTLKEKRANHEWSGIVAMENEIYGTITWKYDILHGTPVGPETHRFGFKRMMYLKKDNLKIVYLVGEGGYGKEVLIQKPAPNTRVKPMP